MNELAEKLARKLIVLDGPDGSGKTSQLAKLREHLIAETLAVELVRDPGTTPVGKKIRNILLDRENGNMVPLCETLLFMASRAQLVEERIRPALAAGKVVLCDRFISATVAYQGASGVDQKTIIELGQIAVGGLWPDLTIILDVPVEVGMQRIGAARGRLAKPPGQAAAQPGLFGDRLEARDPSYHKEVRRLFKRLSQLYPGPVANIPADGPPEEVFQSVLRCLNQAFVRTGD